MHILSKWKIILQIHVCISYARWFIIMANIVRANNEWIALVCYKLEKNTTFRETYPDLEMQHDSEKKTCVFQKHCRFPSKVNKLTLNVLMLYFWRLLKVGGKNQNGTCSTFKTNQIKSYLSLDARYRILTFCVLFLCNP